MSCKGGGWAEGGWCVDSELRGFRAGGGGRLAFREKGRDLRGEADACELVVLEAGELVWWVGV